MDPTEKFERHKSTRWVKAAVPSYGEDWDDNSEYGSDGETGKQPSAPPLPDIGKYQQEIDHIQQNSSHSLENEYNSRDNFNGDGPSNVGARKPTQRKPPTEIVGLVLSIDKFKNRSYKDSSDEEDDEHDTDNESQFSYTEETGELKTVHSNIQELPSVPQKEEQFEEALSTQRFSNSPKHDDQLARITSSNSAHKNQNLNQIIEPTHDNNNGLFLTLSPGQSPAISSVSNKFEPRKSVIYSYGNPHRTNENSYEYATTESDLDSIQHDSDFNIASPTVPNIPNFSRSSSSKNSKSFSAGSSAADRGYQGVEESNKSHEQLILSVDRMNRRSFIHDSDSSDEDNELYTSQYGYVDSADEATGLNLGRLDKTETTNYENKHAVRTEDSDSNDFNDDMIYDAYNDERFLKELNTRENNTVSDNPTFNVVEISDDESELQNIKSAITESLNLNVNKNKDTQVNDIDSLINDLREATFVEDIDDYSLPKVDTGFEVPLPEFDDASDKSSPTSHTKPLVISKEGSKTSLQSAENDGLSYSKSNKRPPPDISEYDEPKALRNSGLGVLVTGKVTEPKNLVSVDYYSTAFAVDDYLNDDSSPEKLRVDEHLEIKPTGEEYDLDSINLELQKTRSSGSLSTGNYSIENSIKSDSITDLPSATILERPGFIAGVTRRDSAMSTMTSTTLKFGNWQPNTNTFRDRFIGDNDNESQYAFDATEGIAYETFTKGDIALMETSSRRSSMSIPETIDANSNTIDLPDIDSDIDKDSSGDLSVLKNQFPKPIKQGIFKESNSITSKENISSEDAPEQKTPIKKYSSLLAPVSSSPASRVPSDSSTFASSISTKNISATSPKSSLDKRSSSSSTDTVISKPGSYPLFSWKTIMSASQSIDRIKLLKEASAKEAAYDSGLKSWLTASLKQNTDQSTLNLGAIATQAYRNAPTSDIRRNHSSLFKSKVSSVRDKVVNESAFQYSTSFGKKIFTRGKKLMRSSD